MTIDKLMATALSLAVLCATAGPAAAEPEEKKPDPAAPEWASTAGLAFPIKLSGYSWIDTGFLRRTVSQQGAFDQDAAYMQGRVVIGAEYARGFGGLYGLAKVQFLGLVNEFAGQKYEPHTLDAFLQVGTRTWDVQLGRFLAMEVYHRGQGIELYTAEEAGNTGAPALYWLDYARGLMDEPGQAAAHWYPADWMALELAGVYGQFAGQNNYYGVRPALAAAFQGFELRAGAEILKPVAQTSQDKSTLTEKGYAASLRWSLPLGTSGGKPPRLAGVGRDDLSGGGTNCGCLQLGVDVARTAVDQIDINQQVDSAKTLDKTSFGGWVDLDFWANSIGLGIHRTGQLNRRGENNNQVQAFASYLYRLPIEGLSVKAVYGIARAHFEDIGTNKQWENYTNSVRVRVLYEFR